MGMATLANPTTRKSRVRPLFTAVRPATANKDSEPRGNLQPVATTPRQKEDNDKGPAAPHTDRPDLNNISKWLADGGGSPSPSASQDKITTKTERSVPPPSSAQTATSTYAGLHSRRSQSGIVQRSKLSEGWWEGNGPFADLARKSGVTSESGANAKPGDESLRTASQEKMAEPDKRRDDSPRSRPIPASCDPRAGLSLERRSKPDGEKPPEKPIHSRSNLSGKWWKERDAVESALTRSTLPDSGSFGVIPRKEASPSGSHKPRPSEHIPPKAGPSKGQASNKGLSREAPLKARPGNQSSGEGAPPGILPSKTLSEAVAAQNYRIRPDSPFDPLKRGGPSTSHSTKTQKEVQPCGSAEPTIQEAWNEKAVLYDIDESQKWHKDFASDIIKRLSPRKGSQVLDLGCGTGLVTLRASKAVGPAGTVIGVDFSSAMLNELTKKKTRSKAYKNVVTIENDVTKLGDVPAVQQIKQKNGGFDIITCISCLDYISDPQTAIKEWAGLLKPGGRIIIDVPAIEERLRSTFEMIIKTLSPGQPTSNDCGITEVVTLAKTFEFAGLEVQEKWCTRDYNGGRICYSREEGEEILQAELDSDPVLRSCNQQRVWDMWWQMWNLNEDEQGDYYDRFKRWVMIATKKVGTDNTRAQIRRIDKKAETTRQRLDALKNQAKTLLDSISEQAQEGADESEGLYALPGPHTNG